jgi:putative membrane protein
MFYGLLYSHMWMARGHFFLGGILMSVFMIIIIGLLIAFLLISLRNNRINSNEEPLKILKRRLAKGEITEKEYNELKKKID